MVNLQPDFRASIPYTPKDSSSSSRFSQTLQQAGIDPNAIKLALDSGSSQISGASPNIPAWDDPNLASYYSGAYAQSSGVQAVAQATPSVQQHYTFGPAAFNAPAGYNPNMYATEETADQIAQMYSLPASAVVQENSAGPFANANAPQFEISNNGELFNAGLLAEQINVDGLQQAQAMFEASSS